MARFSMGAAILTSVLLGVILLSILGISGIFSLIILGFVATYLTAPNQRSYKAGGIAGIILGALIFIYGLFISPTLPIDPPTLSSFTMINLEISGFFTLILGLIISIVICYLFGSIGGLIAHKILKKETKKPKTHVRKKSNERKYKNAPQRSLKKL
jgi:hypothetical protein